MEKKASQKNDLHALNEILQRERAAIINLRMDRLHRIQQDKTRLLLQIRKNAQAPDNEELTLIRKIQTGIRHNDFLLKSGLKLVEKMQGEILSRTAFTYGGDAKTSGTGPVPRMLLRSA